MKSILDKFERSSIIVRLFLILLLVGVLVGGLYYSSQMREQARVEIEESIQVKEAEEKRKAETKEEEKILQNAEAAVKNLEVNQLPENIAPAQEAVSKVQNPEAKANFDRRIQAVQAAITAQQTQSQQISSSVQTYNYTIQPEQNNTAVYNYQQGGSQ